MSFDEDLEDEARLIKTKSTILSSNHTMLLRSSCGSSACTAGIHCAARKRNRSVCQSNHAHAAVNRNKQAIVCSDHSLQKSVSQLHYIECTKRLSTTSTYHSKVQIHRKEDISNLTFDGSFTAKALDNHALEKKYSQECSSDLCSKASKEDMARTLFKRKCLSRTLSNSEITENESVFHSESNASHRNGSRVTESVESEQSYLPFGKYLSDSESSHTRDQEVEIQDFYHNSKWKNSRCNKNYEDYDEKYLSTAFLEKKAAADRSIQEQTSVFWSFFSWRKYLYFALSKPTHYDVELLERIRMFGKFKTTLLLLLPLFLLLLSGMLWRNDTSLQHVDKLMGKSNKNSFMFGWWTRTVIQPIEDNNVVDKLQQPVVLKQVIENQKDNTSQAESQMSRNDIKILIKEILSEGLLPRIQEEKSKGEKIEETKKEIQDIWKELNSFNAKIYSVAASLTSLQQRTEASSNAFSDQEKLDEERSSYFHKVNEEVQSLQKQIAVLDQMLSFAKNCCQNETNIEGLVAAALMTLFQGNTSNSKFQSFSEWMSSEYINSRQLQEEFDKLRTSLVTQESDITARMQASIKVHLDNLHQELFARAAGGAGPTPFSLEVVNKIVKDALLLYDADKLGQTDYALESGGGAVVNTRCSESYNQGQPTINIFGIPLWNLGSSPRNAIQPDLYPGQCWAFTGSQGYLVVELSSTVRPTSFVIEHIPKSLSPTGNIDSAPRDFTVLGLTSEKDVDGKILGEYSYDKDGPSLQQFPVLEGESNYYPFIELQIRSNHGHLKYTCLYRFRVHGIRK